MSKRDDLDLVKDIQEAIRRINSYVKMLDYDDFFEDIKTQDAVVRNLEIVGEAIKSISENLKEKYPEIQWKELAGLRDKLIHHYFGVNYDIVWHIVKNELPDILYHLEKLVNIEAKKDAT
ncbi:MAG: DUF86 domain-containing protein [candidate division KSB1 bacterium]|nr:DUF86 domain-containing protein [candidate division KSB1 bacterium]